VGLKELACSAIRSVLTLVEKEKYGFPVNPLKKS